MDEGTPPAIDYRVVVVSDKHGKITAIYKNSGLENVQEILEAMR
jgi:hypothetical protein